MLEHKRLVRTPVPLPHRAIQPIVSILICCVATCSLAQRITNLRGAGDVERLKIAGTVVNSVTGEPIRRALVTVPDAQTRSVFTDDEGRFSFDNIRATQVMLQVSRPGYFTTPENGFLVDAATASRAIELKLTPSAAIYGRLTGGGDEPIERAPIQIFQSRVMDGKRRWLIAEQQFSDEDGRFRVPNLKPGDYKISVGPLRSRALDSIGYGYALTYHGNARDLASATPIVLAPAQQAEVNFKLDPLRMHIVSGMVIGGNAQGTSLQVTDRSRKPLLIPVGFDPGSGEFRVAMPPGEYTLHAMSNDGHDHASQARLPIHVTNNMTGVLVSLEPSIQIPVVVRKDLSKPELIQTIIGTGTHIRPVSAYIRLSSATDENANVFTSDGPSSQDGSIYVRNVEPGTYEVEVTPNGPWYVASAQCGSKNLLREPLTVTAGAQVDPIEIVLKDDAATFDGSVRGATRHGTLLITSDSEKKRRFRGNFDASGRIYSGPMPPGSYTIYAFEDADAVEYTNPEVLRRYESKAAHATLSANQTATLTVDVIGTEQ